MPRVPGHQLAVRPGDLGQHQVDDVLGQLVLAVADPHLVAAQAVARAERVGLEVGAIGHGARDDVRQAGAGLRLRQAHGAEEAPAELVAREHLAAASACRAPSAGWRCRWSACRRRRCRCRPWRRSCWPPSRPRRAAACRRARSPAPRRACPTRHRPCAAAWLAAGRCTFSPSNQGSSVSARRLNGANFSAASFSQMSSTASKVSRVWSAKRSRACSEARRRSQSWSRKSAVRR